MKTKLSLGLLVVIVLAGAYFFLVPRRSGGPSHTEPAPGAPAPALQAPAAPAPTPDRSEAQKRKELEAAYALLKSDRDELKRKLGLVRTDVWGLKLPAAQARSIENTLLSGYKLLKNPPMLGAFTDVDGVNRERTRVQGVMDDLDGIERSLKEGTDK